MSYDPYYNDQQFMWDMIDSPQWDASEPGLPGDSLSKRTKVLRDIMSMTGIPIVQLLGGGGAETPQAPIVNQTAQMYGSNPMYAEAFAGIDAGKDPETIYQAIMNDASKWKIDPLDNEAKQRVFDTVSAYARDRLDAQTQAAEQGAGKSFTLPNGKKYYGNPDIMGFSTQFELAGKPTVEAMMREYASQRQAKNGAPRKGGVDLFPGVEQAGGKVYQNGRGGGSATMSQEDLMARLGDANKSRNFQAERVFKKRIEDSKSAKVRSDANMNAMRAVLAWRSLVGA